MTNKNFLKGYACPKCSGEGPFNVRVWRMFFQVSDEGPQDWEAVEWDEDDDFKCRACGHEGTAREFKLPTPLKPLVTRGELDQAIAAYAAATEQLGQLALVSVDDANGGTTQDRRHLRTSRSIVHDAEKCLNGLMDILFGEE